MWLQDMYHDTEFAMEIGKLVIFLIITIIGNRTYLSIQKITRHEKNKYLEAIKTNSYVKYTFSKSHRLDGHKYDLLSLIALGTICGTIYLFIVLTLVIMVPLQFNVNIWNYSILTFGLDPNIEFNQKLIFCTYLSIATLPLILGAKIIDYVINLPPKMIINLNDIKRKQVGKIYQILKCQIFILATKLKPEFDNKMLLTKRSSLFLNVLPISIGMIFIIQYFIYSYLFFNYTTDSALPNNWTIVATILVSILSLSIIFLIVLIKDFYVFLEKGKNKIIQFYSKGYPYVYIKTPSGELKGKVENVFNDHIIVLNDKGTQKMTSWNSVEIIEIEKNVE